MHIDHRRFGLSEDLIITPASDKAPQLATGQFPNISRLPAAPLGHLRHLDALAPMHSMHPCQHPHDSMQPRPLHTNPLDRIPCRLHPPPPCHYHSYHQRFMGFDSHPPHGQFFPLPHHQQILFTPSPSPFSPPATPLEAAAADCAAITISTSTTDPAISPIAANHAPAIPCIDEFFFFPTSSSSPDTIPGQPGTSQHHAFQHQSDFEQGGAASGDGRVGCPSLTVPVADAELDAIMQGIVEAAGFTGDNVSMLSAGLGVESASMPPADLAAAEDLTGFSWDFQWDASVTSGAGDVSFDLRATEAGMDLDPSGNDSGGIKPEANGTVGGEGLTSFASGTEAPHKFVGDASEVDGAAVDSEFVRVKTEPLGDDCFHKVGAMEIALAQSDEHFEADDKHELLGALSASCSSMSDLEEPTHGGLKTRISNCD
ncbi:hypothetical protein HK101_005339 [Irineochytrium annulatum]|nr:hypothetical protein HK101_005339 [Irineochytrium annulatum]